MSQLKKTIIRGTVWSILGQMASLLVTLATSIWLARLLSPKEFGQIGIIMFFIVLSNVLTESGLGGALVRKKNASQEDYSTVFVVNLIFSFLCYAALVLFSGTIAAFYNDLLIKNLLITSGLVILINAFELTQSAKLVSEMKFKEQSIYRFISVLTSSIIGIGLAYQGFGVWSLVLIQLITASIYAVLLWSFEGFYMRLYFSKSSFKELYAFGINTTLASLLNTAFDNIYLLVIGKFFSITQTGYFYQAKRLQDIPGGIMNTVTHTVVFSSLAKLQDDKEAFTAAYNKINLYFLLLLGFSSTCIYIYAQPIISILFGSKWLGAVFYMKLLTVASFFYIQEQINRVIFKVFNQTKKILMLELVKKVIQALSIIIGIYFLDLKVLLMGFIFTNILGYLINFYHSREIIGNTKNHEIYTFLKIIFVSAISYGVTQGIINYSGLAGLEILYTFPVLFMFYSLFVQVFKVTNLQEELKSVRLLYRNIE